MYDVIVANGRYVGGGMKITPDAEPDDGMFDVLLIGDISKRFGDPMGQCTGGHGLQLGMYSLPVALALSVVAWGWGARARARRAPPPDGALTSGAREP